MIPTHIENLGKHWQNNLFGDGKTVLSFGGIVIIYNNNITCAFIYHGITPLQTIN